MGRSTVLQTPKDWIHPTSTLTLQFRINILLDHDFNYESFLFFSSIILFFSQNVPPKIKRCPVSTYLGHCLQKLWMWTVPAIVIGINVLHTINRFLIKFEILKAFTSYWKPLPTIKHRLWHSWSFWCLVKGQASTAWSIRCRLARHECLLRCCCIMWHLDPWWTRQANVLQYADDICLLADSPAAAQQLLDMVDQCYNGQGWEQRSASATAWHRIPKTVWFYFVNTKWQYCNAYT